jgi:hypothetical protein
VNALCTSILRPRRRGALARLVVVLVALALAFANVASAAMPSVGDAQASAQHAHCHGPKSAAKHACGDPHAACCAFACGCASTADLAVAPLIAPARPSASRDFAPSSSRFLASIEPRPLRPPIG